MTILTAPFASDVHMASYHCGAFSTHWYEHHLGKRGLRFETLIANGDWLAMLLQEVIRIAGLGSQRGNWSWPFAYAGVLLGLAYFKLRSNKWAEELACFGGQCVSVENV